MKPSVANAEGFIFSCKDLGLREYKLLDITGEWGRNIK